MELRFVRPGDAEYEGELDLRYRVLREPLGMDRSAVAVGDETGSLHLVAIDDGRVVGCVLHVRDDEGDRLRAMAVEPSLQGAGVGAKLVARMEEELRARGVERVVLHARVSAIGFYEKSGYEAYGERFVEVGVPHVRMQKSLVRR